MKRKKKAGMLIVVAALLVLAPLAQGLGFQQGCEEDYRDESECRVDYQAEVEVRTTRTLYFGEFAKDFAYGFVLGPISLLTTFCCGEEKEVSECEQKKPQYKRQEDYRKSCRTQSKSSELTAKLTGWATSWLTIQAIKAACCD